MNTKLLRILGKRGRITIPYEIRQRVGFAYNDVLSFTESADGRSVIVRREKLCDNCQSKTVQPVADDRAMLLELLRSRILDHYNSMVTSVQNHSKVPSFMAKSKGKAPTIELEWDGSQYTASLIDTNKVLGNYAFSSDYTGMKFTASGNTLTITTPTAPTSDVTVSASKKESKRMGLLVWDDGTFGPGAGQQNTVTYTQPVSDPIAAYLKMKVSYGSAKIIKTSEDGKVSGITFHITGNGIDQTVTTDSKGEVQIDNLQPGEYTVTEQISGDYVPQEPQKVTVQAGQTARLSPTLAQVSRFTIPTVSWLPCSSPIRRSPKSIPSIPPMTARSSPRSPFLTVPAIPWWRCRPHTAMC